MDPPGPGKSSSNWMVLEGARGEVLSCSCVVGCLVAREGVRSKDSEGFSCIPEAKPSSGAIPDVLSSFDRGPFSTVVVCASASTPETEVRRAGRTGFKSAGAVMSQDN